MDSASAKAVANQKVFVPLSAVLEVQANFNRLVGQAKDQSDNTTERTVSNTSRSHARGMAQVIKALGLPIDIPVGF